MKKFSGQKNSGMSTTLCLPGKKSCLLPMIQAYYESAEGQDELAEWSEKKDAEDIKDNSSKSA